MSSAGIMDSKGEKRHIKRQRRKRRARSKRQRREQNQRLFGGNNVPDANVDDDLTEERIVSSITQASEAPAAILRRFVWLHLEKVRQFFVPLRTIQYLTGSWTSHSKFAGSTEESHAIKARYVAKLTSPSSPSLLGAKSSTDDGLMSQSIVDNNEWMLRPGRRHRRCHSEQPRAWREPNPGLWTLAEE